MRTRCAVIGLVLVLILMISAQAETTWECINCGKRVPEIMGDVCPYCGSRRHEHTWREATYTEPRTCEECGATEGSPLTPTPTPTPEPTPTPTPEPTPESPELLFQKGRKAQKTKA